MVFKETPYFDRCSQLVENSQWREESKNSERLPLTRSATWAKYPNRYMLSAYASQEKRILRKDVVSTKIFELAILSAIRVDTGMHDYTKYFILPNDDIYTMSLQVSEPGSEQAKIDTTNEFDFVLDNDLLGSNNEDLLKLDHTLNLGYQDGVEPYPSGK